MGRRAQGRVAAPAGRQLPVAGKSSVTSRIGGLSEASDFRAQGLERRSRVL